MPLAKQFWGGTYGQVTDKYGIHWMVNITSRPQQQNRNFGSSDFGIEGTEYPEYPKFVV